MRKLVSVLLILGFTLACASVFADAKQHYMAGKSYYNQGRYQKAIDEFEEAYRLDPRPLLLFNISQALERDGQLAKCVAILKKYITDDPDADTDEIKDKIAVLEAKIASTGIKVNTTEVGAVIYVDGVKVGTTPVPEIIPVDAGQHKIKVVKPGFADFKINVAVAMAQTSPVDVELEAGVSSADKGGPVETVKKDPEDKPEEETGGEEKVDGKIGAMDVVPWVVAGVGVVAAGAGLGVGAKANADVNHDLAVTADIILWPGVALAVAGTVWGIVHITKKKKGESADGGAEVSVVPIIGGHTNGVAASVQF